METPKQPLIRIEQLGVRFGSQTVLRDIDISVNRGDTLAIIGESGCGKTVLLKTIMSLVSPTKGRVVFDDLEFVKLRERELAKQRLRFGFVFQQAALFDSLTIYENVAFALREHTNLPESEIRDRVRDRLNEVGLSTQIVTKKPAELSGGMRKRVGLARALMMEPEVVLYDEPTTGLDPIMSDVINELIIGTRERHGVTSIVVTHDMKSALKIANKIVMLYPIARLGEEDSQILFKGPPEAIESFDDQRVVQFVRGEARDRIQEMTNNETATTRKRATSSSESGAVDSTVEERDAS
ncbi:putative ABC transporter ATP-binding protein [Planctomycetes bacterium Pan216]|uniref:Putative ABC transporter ATP-binding protein n=1 Tax=Kolteria novifilia TaxID=2527975 RepID=A0A518B5L5_9BACT|nr:putative ABC transporter ATP-binding protein [Planctomycetes bacterium Pan216]